MAGARPKGWGVAEAGGAPGSDGGRAAGWRAEGAALVGSQRWLWVEGEAVGRCGGLAVGGGAKRCDD